jgi:hypothetical protein
MTGFLAGRILKIGDVAGVAVTTGTTNFRCAPVKMGRLGQTIAVNTIVAG